MVGTQYTEFYWWHSGYDSSDGSWVGGTYPSCTSQWLSFEFNDPVTLSGYRITSRGLTAYAETDSPKGWALQWSVNGSPPWITVQRVTDEPTWLPLTSREFVVPLAPASKYYRLYFENDAQHNDIGGIHPSDGPRCVVVLAELELFAAFPAPPSPPAPTPSPPPLAPIDLSGTVPVTLVELFQAGAVTPTSGGFMQADGETTTLQVVTSYDPDALNIHPSYPAARPADGRNEATIDFVAAGYQHCVRVSGRVWMNSTVDTAGTDGVMVEFSGVGEYLPT